MAVRSKSRSEGSGPEGQRECQYYGDGTVILGGRCGCAESSECNKRRPDATDSDLDITKERKILVG